MVDTACVLGQVNPDFTFLFRMSELPVRVFSLVPLYLLWITGFGNWWSITHLGMVNRVGSRHSILIASLIPEIAIIRDVIAIYYCYRPQQVTQSRGKNGIYRIPE